jgi:hypothetical protein
MRKSIVILMAVLFSGCGLFKKVEQEKHSTVDTEQHSAVKQDDFTDTSKARISEYWKFKFVPAVNGSEPKTFNPQIPTSDGNEGALRDKMQDLQGANSQLVGTVGYLEGELTRYIDAQKGISHNKSEKDTGSKSSTTDDYKRKQAPATPFWLIIATAIGSGLLPGIIRGIWKQISIKK